MARGLMMKMLTAAVTAALLLQSVSGASALTNEEIKCRSTMSKAFAKYSKTLNKAFVTCHKARDTGVLTGGTDCNDFTTVSAFSGTKVDDARANAQGMITDACTGISSVLTLFPSCPAPYDTLDDGGLTTGIDDYLEVGVCAFAHMNLLAEGMATEILGSPNVFDPALLKCHSALGKAYTKALTGILKARARCQSDSDKSGGPLAYVCESTILEKAQDALVKAGDTIDKACLEFGAGISVLESCAMTAADLAECVTETTDDGSGDLAKLFYTLASGCPGGVSYIVKVSPGSAVDEGLDLGSSGYAHDGGGIPGAPVSLGVSCDEECGNCTVDSVAIDPDACRCRGDASDVCVTNADCSAAPATCDCLYGPPTPMVTGGLPVCVLRKIDGAMSGTYDSTTEDVSVRMPLRLWVFNGLARRPSPCPTCDAGFCSGGERSGLACGVDVVDPDFGNMSYDCPPSSVSNFTGSGTRLTLDSTTGAASMAATFPCSPPDAAFNCPCSYCSLDTSLACHTDADCNGAGTCTQLSGTVPREPNNCLDSICSPDGGAEGTCAGGPSSTYCDGDVRVGGHGIHGCATNAECVSYEPCDGGGCGNCTQSETPDCFLDSITAQGAANSTMVGLACVSPSSNSAVNAAFGLPGAMRLEQSITQSRLCTDGVTPFVAPDGVTCP
jgi:hypothetical protein